MQSLKKLLISGFKALDYKINVLFKGLQSFGILLCGTGLLLFGAGFVKSCAPSVLKVQKPDIIGFVGSAMKEKVTERIKDADDNTVFDLKVDSGGGSVIAGHAIIVEMSKAKKRGIKFRCTVNTMAGSMAFTILQHCDERIAHSKSLIMQHMIHAGDGRENLVLRTNESKIFISFLDKLHSDNLQDKLELNNKEFRLVELLLNFSIWVNGEEAVKLGIIDKLSDKKVEGKKYKRYDEFVSLYKKHKALLCKNFVDQDEISYADIDCSKLKDWYDIVNCKQAKQRTKDRQNLKNRSSSLTVTTEDFCKYKP
jgi:ATP-dependent protease ClpP protease subunit